MGKAGKGFLWGTVVGAVSGSVAALLFAPKPGKELRGDIAEGARIAAERTHVTAEKIGEQSAEIYSKVKSTAGSFITELQSRFDRSKEEIAEAAASIQDEARATEVSISSIAVTEDDHTDILD